MSSLGRNIDGGSSVELSALELVVALPQSKPTSLIKSADGEEDDVDRSKTETAASLLKIDAQEREPWVHFHEIETKYMCFGFYSYHVRGSWSLTAKVLAKKGICVCNGESYLHCILIDEEGSKMDAMSFGDGLSINLNRIIIEGNTYDFKGVEFMSTDHIYLQHIWSTRSEYYVKISSSTKIGGTVRRLNIPFFPRSFLEFENLICMKHHMLTDVIGLVIYISEIQGEKNFQRIPSKHVAIMNKRGKVLIIHVHGLHVTQYDKKWRTAEIRFRTIAAVNVKVDWTRGVVKTSTCSQIIFSPQKTETTELQGLRKKLLSKPHQAIASAQACMKDLNML